jgi:hypothetical protein
LADALGALRVLDVTVDVATGKLTPAVHDLAAEEVDAALLHMAQDFSRQSSTRSRKRSGGKESADSWVRAPPTPHV